MATVRKDTKGRYYIGVACEVSPILYRIWDKLFWYKNFNYIGALPM